MPELTEPQQRALRWLYNRAGSGVFERNNQVLIAQGERAAAERKTWNALRDAGYVSIDKYRATITEEGEHYCRSHTGIKECATAPGDEDF